jgi:hypothetical protein
MLMILRILSQQLGSVKAGRPVDSDSLSFPVPSCLLDYQFIIANHPSFEVAFINEIGSNNRRFHQSVRVYERK